MHKKWWKEGVVYQIYPRSFMDSNGDGIGDLRGITSKLDYIQDIGINIVWLCPIYQSPNFDNGYDISNYYEIMTELGTMEDWEELLEGLHQRGIKLIMDLVVNHTSDQHPWFIESRSSKNNKYRDYYIWRSGKNSKEMSEPNNWSSEFGGSAWEYDQVTDEYYLHIFSTKQPDLNWENKELRREIFKMMKWWLDKGIDGFRMDVITMISKNQDFPDAPKLTDAPYQWGGEFFINGPKLQYYLREMYTQVLSKYNIMTVGEAPETDPEEASLIVDERRHQLDMIFQFELMEIDYGPKGKWDQASWKLTDFKNIITNWQRKLQGNSWNSIFLNNHDHPRMVSRFANDSQYRVESAKMLATLLHTLQGTPFMYQGEEIGMTNIQFPDISDYRDIETINMYNEAIKNKVDHQTIMNSIYAKGRDNARTPMQWDDSKNAGFTKGTPWINVNPNYIEINVKQAISDSGSILNYYKNLIKLRKSYPVIVYGNYQLLLPDHERIFAYERKLENEVLLTILNFSPDSTVFDLSSEIHWNTEQLLICNYTLSETTLTRHVTLNPFEARLYLLK